jgi:hypothetical protein
MRSMPTFFLILILSIFSSIVQARVISVGPTGDFQRIAEAANHAKDGDIVEITAGEWRGDVALWGQKELTIRGVGRRPVLLADGKSMEGKAIWVIRKGNFLIENIEFRGTRVADGNGAGIRFEGGKLVVRNSAFHDNQMGLLTSPDPTAELVIENCIFADAPAQSQPFPHLLYVGAIASVRISGSRFHRGHVGHLIKSRAKITDLRYNLIFDTAQGQSSYEIDLPNGGDVTILGNVIGQSEISENPVMIAYAAEGKAWPVNQLRVIHNTMISEGVKPAWFIRVWNKNISRDFKADIFNNLWSGYGLFDYGVSSNSSGNYWIYPGLFFGKEFMDFSISEKSRLHFNAEPLPVGLEEFHQKFEFALPIGFRVLSIDIRRKSGAIQN